MNHEPIKTAEERIHPLALDDKSVWCNAYFDEVAELRAQNKALKQENEKQAKRIAELESELVEWNEFKKIRDMQMQALRKQMS